MTTTQTLTNTNNADAAAVDWLPINPDIIPLTGWEALSDGVDGRHSYFIEYYKA